MGQTLADFDQCPIWLPWQLQPAISLHLSVRFDWDGKLKLFYHSAYFCYYLWL